MFLFNKFIVILLVFVSIPVVLGENESGEDRNETGVCNPSQWGSIGCPPLVRTTSLKSNYSLCYPIGAPMPIEALIDNNDVPNMSNVTICQSVDCQMCDQELHACFHQKASEDQTGAHRCSCLNQAQACYQGNACDTALVQEKCPLVPGCICDLQKLARCQECFHVFEKTMRDWQENTDNQTHIDGGDPCPVYADLIQCYSQWSCDHESSYSPSWAEEECRYQNCSASFCHGDSSDETTTYPDATRLPTRGPDDDDSERTSASIAAVGVILGGAFLLFIMIVLSLFFSKKKDHASHGYQSLLQDVEDIDDRDIDDTRDMERRPIGGLTFGSKIDIVGDDLVDIPDPPDDLT